MNGAVRNRDGNIIDKGFNKLSTQDGNLDGLADDRMIEIAAVGAAGGAPLPGFLEGVFGPPGP